jgi:hypothetical protein
LLLLASPGASQQGIVLGEPRAVAPGIALYHVKHSLGSADTPLSIWLLRLTPDRVTLRLTLSNDEVMGTETVGDTAARHKAAAAINAGFFMPNGDPSALLTLNGRLVSDTRRARGALGILDDRGRTRLLFDRVSATAAIVVDGKRITIDGVDTTRARGKLMLFTPAYHEHTDTADGGTEWVVSGQPLRVQGTAKTAGRTPIPRDGFVLSFGGIELPPELRKLRRGARVAIETQYAPTFGRASEWSGAKDIISGQGLLARDGEFLSDWSGEGSSAAFVLTRHPRTLIGTEADGTIWLITVDGRQPEHSVGMSFVELQALARDLKLTNALNLDGGGSTTMWVQGDVVNRPSDPQGPRKVSDALLVFPK